MFAADQTGRLRQGVRRRKPFRRAREPRSRCKVMVQKNGTDKLIARVVYNGPGAGARRGRSAGRRRQGLARRQYRRRDAALYGGRRRHGIDHAARRRRRQRTGDRDCSAPAPRSSDMTDTPTTPPPRGRFVTFRGRRGRRQIDPDQDSGRPAGGRRQARHRHPRARRLARRRDHPPCGAVGHGQAARRPKPRRCCLPPRATTMSMR